MSDVLVTGPGIYDGLDESAYHEDASLAPSLGRSLSSTGAKTILDCPARFAWERDHPVHKAEYDLGSAVHAFILGVGDEQIVEVKADSWRGKAAQDERKAAHAARKSPLLTETVQQARDIAAAALADPIVAGILSEGAAEQSLYWIDEQTSVTCRGRVDWLHPRAIVDVKTARKYGARPSSISKACADYGYAQQADFYRRGVYATTGRWLPFLHVFVEVEPPYLVTVGQLGDDDLDIGARLNDQALALYAACESAGDWPAYSHGQIVPISLPRWYVNR